MDSPAARSGRLTVKRHAAAPVSDIAWGGASRFRTDGAVASLDRRQFDWPTPAGEGSSKCATTADIRGPNRHGARVTKPTVQREWSKARLLLKAALQRARPEPDPA